MNRKIQEGKHGEHLAHEHLTRQGLFLIERNYRCRTGELDLVMRDGQQIVFVEVRFRRNTNYGSPAETITTAKQKRLIRAAAFYLQNRRIDAPCRFDVVAISRRGADYTLEWIRNAFQAG